MEHCTNGNNWNIFLLRCQNRITQVINSNICLSGGRQGNAVIDICREVYDKVQPLLRKISFFLRGIKERMDCVGIPVQNDAYVLQRVIAALLRSPAVRPARIIANTFFFIITAPSSI